MSEQPLPNTKVAGETVIASCVYREADFICGTCGAATSGGDHAVLPADGHAVTDCLDSDEHVVILLAATAPYFRVAHVHRPAGARIWVETASTHRVRNIHDAISLFDDWGGGV